MQIWYGAVLRGDKNKVKIGRLTNVQDRAVISTVANLESGYPSNVEIGDMVCFLTFTTFLLMTACSFLCFYGCKIR